MKIFTSEQIREIDAYTITNEPVDSIDLMERAAMACSDWISNRFSSKKCMFKFVVGPGNNGGDGLAIARQLADKGYKPEVYLVRISNKMSPDAQENLSRLKNQGKVNIVEINDTDTFPPLNEGDIILDGLFGSGLTRPLAGFPARIVQLINQSPAKIISIDIPSGLFGEDNSSNNFESIIKSDYTLSFQFPKLAFFYPGNAPYVGDWHILPIGLHDGYIQKMGTPFFYINKSFVSSNLKKRQKFAHKGNFGHALLVSGSYGMMGAAILATRACLKTGTGLVTAHIPKNGYDIMQISLPEAIISIDASNEVFTSLPDITSYNAIGVGPGLGNHEKTHHALESLLNTSKCPIVIDADGLNILSQHREWLKHIPEKSILTPHPKEFERLTGKTVTDYQRNQVQIEFARQYKIFVVLKGAHTSIACPDGTCYFNTSGNPGMATAGSGDVLTGIILSLLAQGYTPKMSALIGVFLHGMAGDIACGNDCQEVLLAGDIIENIGKAYKELKSISLSL